MRKKLVTTVVIAAAAAGTVAATVPAYAGGGDDSNDHSGGYQELILMEKVVQSEAIDLGASGQSLGDETVFSSDLSSPSGQPSLSSCLCIGAPADSLLL